MDGVHKSENQAKQSKISSDAEAKANNLDAKFRPPTVQFAQQQTLYDSPDMDNYPHDYRCKETDETEGVFPLLQPHHHPASPKRGGGEGPLYPSGKRPGWNAIQAPFDEQQQVYSDKFLQELVRHEDEPAGGKQQQQQQPQKPQQQVPKSKVPKLVPKKFHIKLSDSLVAEAIKVDREYHYGGNTPESVKSCGGVAVAQVPDPQQKAVYHQQLAKQPEQKPKSPLITKQQISPQKRKVKGKKKTTKKRKSKQPQQVIGANKSKWSGKEKD